MAFFDGSTLQVLCGGLGYPEGPVAMPDGTLLITDIKNQSVTRIGVDGSVEAATPVPGGPNGGAIGPDGKLYICNSGGFDWSNEIVMPDNQQLISFAIHQAPDYRGGSVQRLDLDTGSLETVYTQFAATTAMTGLGPRPAQESSIPPQPLRGPDDLVFDHAGGFWFADFGKSRARERDVTGLYYGRPDGSYLCEKVFPLDAPNGIALSPAGDRVYCSLTFERTLLYWELDPSEPGTIVPNPATMDGAYVLNHDMPGLLDSIKVDAEGNVYALTMLPRVNPFFNGGVTVVSPDGEIVEYFEIDVPKKHVPMPSNICWGGVDGRTAFITCGASDMILTVRTAVPGLAPAFAAPLRA